MKYTFSLFIILICLTSCKKENKDGYVINGKAENVQNGIRVYLKTVGDDGREKFLDTAKVMDEQFKMSGKVNEPSVHFLTVDGTLGNSIFMLENSEIDIEINKEKIMLTKVSGSKTNIACQQYQQDIFDMIEKNNVNLKLYSDARMTNDIKGQDSLSAILEQIGKDVSAYPLTFIDQNRDSDFSLNLIGLESNKQKFDVVQFMEAYDKISDRLKKTDMAKKVKARLDELYAEYQKIAHLEIGKIAPNFEAPNTDGKMISLNDIKGKVTVIDFWAAWCGPCRKENPNVVRIYNKFHDKGLEIIGVSLDGQERQQDPKKAWIDAIAKDGLKWNHVSHLKYFNDPVAKQYNIQSIPATFILDAEGKIVAKNLRGKALEDKIEQLLNQS